MSVQGEMEGALVSFRVAKAVFEQNEALKEMKDV